MELSVGRRRSLAGCRHARRRRGAMLTLLLAVVTTVVAALYGAVVGAEELTVGAIFPMSGPSGEVGGTPSSQGVMLAIEEIARTGLLAAVNLTLRYDPAEHLLDDGSQPIKGVCVCFFYWFSVGHFRWLACC